MTGHVSPFSSCNPEPPLSAIAHSQHATETVTYEVHPYGLTFHRGSLYLVGFAPQHDNLRHWKVDRIEAAELDVMPFRRPDDFDLKQHLSGSFGVFQGDGDVRVRIRFTADVARDVRESKWHDSQQLTPQGDGSRGCHWCHWSPPQSAHHWIGYCRRRTSEHRDRIELQAMVRCCAIVGRRPSESNTQLSVVCCS